MTTFSSGYGKPKKYSYITTDQARRISLAGGGGGAPAPAPAAPAAAPSAPPVGAPPPDDPSVLPPDPIYDGDVGLAVRIRDDTVADLKQQRSAALLNYGYTEQDNPDGTVAALNFDASNPYSQAALLRTHYAQAKAGTNTSLGAQGQLWSGARNNAQNQNDSAYNQSDDSLQKALLGFLANNTIGKRDAIGTTYDTAVSAAAAARLGRAPDSPLYNPATGGPSVTNPTGAAATAKANALAAIRNAPGDPSTVSPAQAAAFGKTKVKVKAPTVRVVRPKINPGLKF